MKDIPGSSIDLILQDPPFNSTACHWEWDIITVIDELWDEWKRIIKPNGAIVMFGSQPFTSRLIASNYGMFKYCWYWLKNQGTNFFHAKKMPIRKIEEICVFGGMIYNPQITEGHKPTNSAKGCSNGKSYHGTNKRNYNGGSTQRLPTNILEFKCVDNYSRVHSSEKPVPLLEYLIKTYTNEGETVFDGFTGSASTGVACINTNRNFIGIEKDEKYFKLATERLNNATLPVF